MNRSGLENGGEDFRRWRAASVGALSFLLLFGQTALLLGNPTGGAVVAGSATIGSAGLTLTINQSTQSAIVAGAGDIDVNTILNWSAATRQTLQEAMNSLATTDTPHPASPTK